MQMKTSLKTKMVSNDSHLKDELLKKEAELNAICAKNKESKV